MVLNAVRAGRHVPSTRAVLFPRLIVWNIEWVRHIARLNALAVVADLVLLALPDALVQLASLGPRVWKILLRQLLLVIQRTSRHTLLFVQVLIIYRPLVAVITPEIVACVCNIRVGRVSRDVLVVCRKLVILCARERNECDNDCH